MLYYLSQWLLDRSVGTPWADRLSALRLFKYITVRSAGAAVTALLLSWWLGPKVIRWLKQLKFGQEYADKAEVGGIVARELELVRRWKADEGALLASGCDRAVANLNCGR